MKFTTSKLVAAAAAGALVLAGALVSTEAANAAQITAGNPVITLYGPSATGAAHGPTITSGSATAAAPFYGISISEGCPAGFQQRSDTLVYQNGALMGSLAGERTTSTTLYGDTGLDGNPIAMDDTYTYPNKNTFVANKALSALATPLVAGQFDVRYYCEASSSNPNPATDDYFDIPMTLSSDLSTWSLYTPAAATTVSLTAAANPNSTITLTGTVMTPTNTVATNAIGSIEFFNSSNTEIGSGTVSNGVGTFTTAAETPGQYSFTAEFVGNNDPNNANSAMSGTATTTVAGSGVAPSTITVTIPSGQGALTMTGVQSSINLGTAALNGSVLTASGTLGPVTINDTRQTGSNNWSVTGQDTDFTSGANTFDGGFLGWTPSLVGTTNAGVAGAVVAPKPGGAGLKAAAATLASGGVVVGTPNTVVQAALLLAVPQQTPGGVYTSTLTITLIP